MGGTATCTSLEERQAIRASVRRLLTEQSSEKQVRLTMASQSGYDPALWSQLAEVGVQGTLIDVEHGGLGTGPVELELIMEEAGAALLCAPLLSSAVLAAGLLSFSSDTDAKARLLPEIASGKRIATVAITGERGLWTPDDVDVKARRSATGWQLEGTASFVTAATQADTLLIVARSGVELAAFEISPQDAGVVIQPLETFDPTLRLARITLSGAAGNPIRGVDSAVIEKMLDLARVALAGEQAGAARRVFDMTTEYIKTRVQFGRPVGGFQAIKHMAADL